MKFNLSMVYDDHLNILKVDPLDVVYEGFHKPYFVPLVTLKTPFITTFKIGDDEPD